MLQKETDSNLSAQQIQAIELLIGGSSVTAAADELGVARSTIHRWLKDDYEFQAILNKTKRILVREAETRLLALVDCALDTLQTAIRNGDSRAAVAVLKGTGLLSGQPVSIGHEDVDLLRRTDEQDVRDVERDLGLRQMMLAY